MMSARPSQPPRPAARSRFSSAAKGLGSALAGAFLAALVFLALPLLQMVANLAEDDKPVAEVTLSQDEELPPVVEEQEEPEPEPESEPPPPPQNLTFADLSPAFDAGSAFGSGPAVLSALQNSLGNQIGNALAASGQVREPRPIKRVAPRLSGSLRGSISGIVKVECTVDASGRVVNPKVVSAPDPRLERPTIAAVLKWKFEPGTRDGVKCPFKVKIPIRIS